MSHSSFRVQAVPVDGDGMDEASKLRRIEDFDRLCRERGLPRTAQRRLILETVLEAENHPTADEVFERVSVREPRVSRATVYRTLETLVSLRLITKVCHPGSAVRYDRRIDVHHHLVCMRCDAIIDFTSPQLDLPALPDTSAVGFEVDDYRVQIRGLCRTCKEREEET